MSKLNRKTQSYINWNEDPGTLIDFRKFVQSAKWIWYDSPSYDLVNSWMQTRKTFYLKKVPKTSIVYVTADTQYRLYVNGIYINRGPARGFQESWSYDNVNITPFLKKGRNVIAALVHNLGISTFQYIHQGYAGFLLAGKADDEEISTNQSWRVRIAPGYKRVTTRVSLQLGFQEFFDARLDDSWVLSDYDDSSWDNPRCRNFGSMPWYSFEKREIPLLKETIAIPDKLISETKGKCKVDYEKIANVVSLFLEEEKNWYDTTNILTKDDNWARFQVPATSERDYRGYLIDFGKEFVGSLLLNVENGEGGEIIDTMICEGKENFSPIIYSSKVGCKVAFGNRLFLRAGKTEYEQFDYWGFRYLILIVRNSKQKLTIKLKLRSVGYPLQIKAEFQSSDERLNKIYKMSTWTQQCCMQDAYVDCPWREQAQWWGDARIQAKNTFYLSADERLFKRGIKQIGTQKVPNGLTYGHAPTIAHGCILPDFTLTWIITHWDYYWQTADLSLFKQMKDKIYEAFDYFFQMTGKNGLISYDNRYALFLDWSPLFKDGYSTLYNLFYLMALRTTIKLLEQAGEEKLVQLYSRRERSLLNAIKKMLFNRKTQTLYGGLSWNNQPVVENTPHIYSLAILLDLFPEYHQLFVQKYLLPLVKQNYPQAEGAKGAKGIPSPFFMHYIFEALKKCGCMEEVADCIYRWWGEMVAKGLSTTEEVWNAKPGLESLCHAWSAHPIIHLSNILLGIWQKSPGWNKICFSPTFTCVNFVRGKVATPKGIIESGWERTKAGIKTYLSLPQGITAEVTLPGRKKEILKSSNKGKWTIMYREILSKFEELTHEK
ncbi:hypothetical protein KKC91_02465 [bacterium]|nr:hypothetical protein [bacterium]